MVPLDPAAKRLLDMLAVGGMADIATMTPQQMRDGFRRLAHEAYAKLLRHEGVAARYTCHAGMIHYFYAMAGAIPAARTALKAAAADMRTAQVAGQNY
jgi:acetyl esterase/lipase